MSPGVWIRSVSGQAILVDREDQDLALTRWYSTPRGYFVAFPVGYRRDPSIRYLSLHRVILERMYGPGKVADHINRDKSDNRRSNLRWVTYTQSNWNRRGAKTSLTGYKGVVLRRNCKVKIFGAMVEAGGKVHHLGGFRTAEDAARAYDRAARRLGGEYAALNFPNEVV